MKIQEVTIEGYQSHTNSTFRLSPCGRSLLDRRTPERQR